ncbi:MAG TPA: hypothetical protein PL196_03215, partial [Burkholderiaceae bacterium]|nr:hypothetical protein [Burkholderiaceae bacterium]
AVELELARVEVLEMDYHRISKVLFRQDPGARGPGDLRSPASAEDGPGDTAARQEAETARLDAALYDGSEITLEDESGTRPRADASTPAGPPRSSR